MLDAEISEEKPVVQCDENATGRELARLMKEYNVGAVVVTDGDSPVGIVTDRDLAIVFGQSEAQPDDTIAGRIMRTPVTTIEAGSSLMQIVQTMGSAGVRRLPVVDGDQKLVDIVTMDDIVHLLAQSMGGLEDIIEAESPRNVSEFG